MTSIPTGVATGIGSLPGTDPVEAAATVWGELPDFPHLPELPDRGVGADMIGRTGALLADLALEVATTGWRLASHPSLDQRRARDLLERDLDAVAVVAAGYAGPIKLQLAGPWTLAAAVELPRGEKAVGDAGAVRDIRQSMAEGVRAHLADLRARMPGGRFVAQLDEPSLPAVLAGQVRVASGLGVIPAVPDQTAEQDLAELVESVDAPVLVHCCAADVPVDLLRRAGVAGLAVGLNLLTAAQYDAIGAALEAGVVLALGIQPEPARSDATEMADAAGVARGDVSAEWADHAAAGIRELLARVGFDPGSTADRVLVTPTCGLASATPAEARAAMQTCRHTASRLLS